MCQQCVDSGKMTPAEHEATQARLNEDALEAARNVSLLEFMDRLTQNGAMLMLTSDNPITVLEAMSRAMDRYIWAREQIGNPVTEAEMDALPDIPPHVAPSLN